MSMGHFYGVTLLGCIYIFIIFPNLGNIGLHQCLITMSDCGSLPAINIITTVMGYHEALSVWEDAPGNNKGTNGLPTSRPLSFIVGLMVVIRHACRVIWVMWIITVCSRRRGNMVVADGLAPVWRQAICNYHNDPGWTTHIRGDPM